MSLSCRFTLNVATRKLHDDGSAIQIMRECIKYLEGNGQNNELLESLQLRLCRFLIRKKKTSEAKAVASKLCALNNGNQRYKAMLLLTAVHDEGTGFHKNLFL